MVNGRKGRRAEGQKGGKAEGAQEAEERMLHNCPWLYPGDDGSAKIGLSQNGEMIY